MQKLPVAMVVSISCHIAAMGWVVHDRDVLAVPLRVAAAVPAPPPVTPPRDSEPIEVVLFDARVETAPQARAERTAGATSATAASPGETGAAAFSIDRTGRAELPHAETQPSGTEPAHSAPGRSRWMTMRRPEPHAVELSEEFLQDFLARTRPLAPPPDIPGERIGNEIAEVRSQMRHARPEQVEALRRQLVALYDERDAEELKAAGHGTYRADKETFKAKVDPDGTVHLKDKPDALDRQDKLMLSKGIDPYARNKLAFLDRTRDQRIAVGERWHHEQLAHAAQRMQANIDRLWAMTSDLPSRKAGLFELWDDCAETGTEEVVAAASAARALVIGVIRLRLRGSDAYTTAELARFNTRRRSTTVFAPYE